MAAGTFSQIYIQLVFAVKGRQSLISQKWEDELFKYITGIVQNKGQKLMAINGVPDHIHLLIGMKPSCRLSDLVREIKKSSNTWINEQGFIKGKFEWQQGYGAFSYSQSAIDQVAKYVMNQKEHHKKRSFKQEYVDFLKKYELPFDERYLFDWLA
jgi:REP element-mobilizing transposase RayT